MSPGTEEGCQRRLYTGPAGMIIVIVGVIVIKRHYKINTTVCKAPGF